MQKHLFKKMIGSIVVLLALPAFAGLQSPFPSEVPGLSIPNAHVILNNDDGKPLVVRGMAPTREQMVELQALGIDKVLIFKNETKNEVVAEQQDLYKLGYESYQVTHIPFPWKDLHNFNETCQMTVQALQTIESAIDGEAPLFFHCSVGEDRTGYLAGLFRIWSSPEQATEDVFAQELCARGYEAGNKRKPKQVVSAIRETLTPSFVAMSSLLKQWRKDGIGLDPRNCPRNMRLPEAKNLICR